MEKPTPPAAEAKKPKSKPQYKEAEVMISFGLSSIAEYQTPLMAEWLAAKPPVFDASEQGLFDRKLKEAINKISGWNEEELKMKFISAIIELGQLTDGDGYVAFFDRTISATVEDVKLTVKPDFIMAKGFRNLLQKPYFHFHEYKPHINPKGEPMAQLLQAFLIAQQINQDGKPLYGAEIFGANWRFVVMEGKQYCVSPQFDSTSKDGLFKIIAILREFRNILETKLL